MVSNKRITRSTWINADFQKPNDSEKIILIDYMGIFTWGIYYNIGDGLCYIEGRESDAIKWSDVSEWVLYPKDSK